MKTFLTLFFLCQNFQPWSTFSHYQSKDNDQVRQDDVETITYNLNKYILNGSSFSVKLDEAKKIGDNLDKQYQLSLQKMFWFGAQLFEISDEVFNKLVIIKPNVTIEYALNYSYAFQLIDNPDQILDFSGNVSLAFNQNWVDQTNYLLVNQKYKTMISQNNHWDKFEKRIFFDKNIFQIVSRNLLHYFAITTTLGIDLSSIWPTIINYSKPTFSWLEYLILESIQVKIHTLTFHFEYHQPFSEVYFYDDKSKTNLDQLLKKFRDQLQSQYFWFLSKTYPEIKFNYARFWNNFNLDHFNEQLISNKLVFRLFATDQLNQKFVIKIYFTLIYQQHFKWTKSKDYEFSQTELTDFINEIKQLIINQGYELSWFKIEIVDQKIIISSLNQKMLSFDPIEINYQLIEAEKKIEAPLLPNEIEEEDSDKTSLIQEKFNSNLFYLLLIPLGFFFGYLTTLFQQKIKKKNLKMIK